MKANKFMIAALFMGALSFVACNKDNNPKDPDEGKQPADTTVVPVEPSEDELPDLDKPAAGILRIVLEIPEGTECNGIALKGTFNGSDWSGENTYLGEEGAQTPVANKIYRFAAYEKSEKYYTLDLPVGETPEAIQFKVCLIYNGDGSWQGQAEGAAIHECNFSSVAPSVNGGQFVFGAEANPSGQLLYIMTGEWQHSECVVRVEHDYNVTVKVPTCSETVPELVGDFDSWAGTALTKDGDVWKATIHAAEGDKIKVREAGNTEWTNQIQEIVDDVWNNCGDMKLGKELNFDIDFSNAEKYRWTVCAE